MRNKIWHWIIRNKPGGSILPKYMVALRAILFPLDFFYWKMSKSRGYQVETNTWYIHGIKYANRGLVNLSRARGEIYKITSENGVVAIERVKPGEKE